METIGDCYVAVAGLPEPRQDHAVVMARFARDCMQKMNEITKKLEVTLGPDTGDLTVRIGLHSGPVTAGVLRGEKSRFQLFGDTVNTAARLESTGERKRIQISEETASLIKQAGKENWIKPRKEPVVAKGKGEMKTYWLNPKSRKGSSTAGTDVANDDDNISIASENSCHQSGNEGSPLPTSRTGGPEENAKIQRLIGWNVDVLLRLLKMIVASRGSDQQVVAPNESVKALETQILVSTTTVEAEVPEFVSFLAFDEDRAVEMASIDPENIMLTADVEGQLRDYVALIASMYGDHPFHNFEHASHVTMSVSKLLGRIVSPDHVDPAFRSQGPMTLLSSMHEKTYGITSDPLAQFAVVFSALIHDVDHRGIPNFILMKENPDLAKKYNHRSTAEQNSVDLAWERLMGTEFDQLRHCIYSNTTELLRFRKLVVNTVMATDIFDKEFATLRKQRWERCFHNNDADPCNVDDVNRRATIVMEHLIQASDVAHTMQHWQIFQKWNSRLLTEMYRAYKAGRSEKDPSTDWYLGELGFLDNYVIPLAKKLKECGVFGVSSDEYLNYALENRREWANRGQEMVDQLMARINQNGETVGFISKVVGDN